ncbi:MAG: hypothetical protein P8I85_02355 [Flavobacteriaceae bacterium]|jgi:hypothetical protein|nr:hypothetical protein [Flavobacteriaceae bacterium]MDG1830552.1 hypothetical protein [Flavobacteriaceae bacterium]
MNKLSKNSIPKLGRKINQLKKKISRNEINGDMEKVEFRKMRIKKIQNQIDEILKKKKKKTL